MIEEILDRHNGSLREMTEFTFSVLENKDPELLRMANAPSPIDLFHSVDFPVLFELCLHAEQLIGEQMVPSYKAALKVCEEHNSTLTYVQLIPCAKKGKHEFDNYVNHGPHTIGTCKICTYKRVIEGNM